MKLKPYENSKELLGMTRAEAKMYEYSVPEENRIHINKENIKDLFILTIALLGDYAANFYKEVDTENQLIDLKNNLVFSAQFFDAYLNAKLQDSNKDYYIIMGSSAYYLCDYMGRHIKKHIIKKYLHDNREVLRPVFMTFPSYFAQKMENI